MPEQIATAIPVRTSQIATMKCDNENCLDDHPCILINHEEAPAYILVFPNIESVERTMKHVLFEFAAMQAKRAADGASS